MKTPNLLLCIALALATFVMTWPAFAQEATNEVLGLIQNAFLGMSITQRDEWQPGHQAGQEPASTEIPLHERPLHVLARPGRVLTKQVAYRNVLVRICSWANRPRLGLTR